MRAQFDSQITVENPLDAIPLAVKNDLEKVDGLIKHHMQSEVSMIPKLGDYIISAGGKRIRPILTLASAHLCFYEGEEHLGLATAVEFLHTATLLHDDVVDKSDLRRGEPSANAVFGNQYSVLVGDFLFSRAFELMVQSESLPVLNILHKAASTIAEGEVLQLQIVGDLKTTEKHYFDVIRAKTAALFSASCSISAVIAKKSETIKNALSAYGEALGMVFQITDDLLDYFPGGSEHGKDAGDDFREGKLTLPLILAYRSAEEDSAEEEITFWKRTIVEGAQISGDFEQACLYLEARDVYSSCIKIAESFSQKAKIALTCTEKSEYKLFLESLIDSVLRRAQC